jgi:predicted Fe-S protein YdhL (DUF1289 family)
MSAPTISTPCVKVCVIDPHSALCVGCGRSLKEIARWTAMSEAERRAVMAGLGERLASARSRASRGGALRAHARFR